MSTYKRFHLRHPLPNPHSHRHSLFPCHSISPLRSTSDKDIEQTFLQTGAALAHKFASHYPVALLARNPANYEPVVEAINAAGHGNKAVGFQTDVSSRAALKETLAAAGREFGFAKDDGGLKVAAAVFNVSGSFVRKPFLELEEGDIEKGYEGSV